MWWSLENESFVDVMFKTRMWKREQTLTQGDTTELDKNVLSRYYNRYCLGLSKLHPWTYISSIIYEQRLESMALSFKCAIF